MGVRPRETVTLPTNPNAIVFSTAAALAFAQRSWSQIEELGIAGLKAFHEHSGLPAVAGFSWRTDVDRKNRKIAQLLCFYVIDGPASAGDLAALEAAMRNSNVTWSTAQIERIPAQAATSLMIRSGRIHQLWAGTAADPRMSDLVWAKERVHLRERGVDEVDPAEFPKGVRHVLAVPPRFEDHDADLERMRLVFARHFANRIVEADGRIREEELVFLDSVFPGHLLRRLEVADAERAEHWFEKACEELPKRLGHHDKLAMIGLFFSACYSDGSLDAREMRVLREAGEALGLTRQQVATYLERFW